MRINNVLLAAPSLVNNPKSSYLYSRSRPENRRPRRWWLAAKQYKLCVDDMSVAVMMTAYPPHGWWTPFYELPFARSGKGTAWNGLSKHDLTKCNYCA